MVKRSRIIRIFVSSTFTDMKAERDHLHETAFKRLDEYCQLLGWSFQAIDLRWGIPEEANVDQKTVALCEQEIERCIQLSPKPNFLVLLGDRYGWCPPPAEIPRRELRALRPYLSPEDKTLVDFWYREDENAVIKSADGSRDSMFELLPRRGDRKKWQYDDIRPDDKEKLGQGFEPWRPVEARLRGALLSAAEKAGITGDALVKYYASATHREIRKGVFDNPDAASHVQCFVREFTMPVPQNYSKDFVESKGERINLLAGMKKRLEECLGKGVNYHVYPVDPETSVPPAEGDYLSPLEVSIKAQVARDGLGDKIFGAFKRIIDQRVTEFGKMTEVEEENEAHREFAAERAVGFVGREEIIKDIVAYMKGDDQTPHWVVGAPGSGKSALFARLGGVVETQVPGVAIIPRFIGQTQAASNSRDLIRSLVCALKCIQGMPATAAMTPIPGGWNGIPGTNDEVPSEYHKLVAIFSDMLSTMQPATRVLLIIDAVDQLAGNDPGRDAAWLPPVLAPRVKVVLSAALDATNLIDAIERRYPRSIHHLSCLSEHDGGIVLDGLLDRAGRGLQGHQRREVIDKFVQSARASDTNTTERTGLPLFLKVVFEICRYWNSYDDPSATVLPSSVDGAIAALLDRVEMNHFAGLASLALGCIACARNGLSEIEILDLFSHNESFFTRVRAFYEGELNYRFPTPRVPWILWSRLHAEMTQFLGRRGAGGVARVSLFHRQFYPVIEQKYLAGSEKITRHAAMALYFENATLDRKIDEYPYQLQQSGQLNALKDALTDLTFFEYAFDNGREYEWYAYWCTTGIQDEMKKWYQAALNAQTKPGDELFIARLATKIGLFMMDVGEYRASAPFIEMALPIKERVLGPDHPDVASSLNIQATLLTEQGKFADALLLNKRSLEICKRAYGPNDPAVAQSLNNIANLLKIQGKFNEALPLLQSALTIIESAFGLYHPIVAWILANLAGILHQQGKITEAILLNQRALMIRERALGPNHPHVALILNHLAQLLQAQGNFKEGTALYQRALKIDEQSLGPGHLKIAMDLNNLADLLRAQGKYNESISLFKQALAIRESHLDPDHPDIANSFINIAEVDRVQGNFSDALSLIQRAQDITERVVGSNHPDYATILNNKAMLLKDLDNLAEAYVLFKRALAIRERAFGADHLDVAQSLSNLATLLYAQSNSIDALPLFQRALSIFERSQEQNASSVAFILNNLSILLKDQGKISEATSLCQRALSITERTLGPTHPDYAVCLYNMASILVGQRKFNDALPLLRQSLSILESVFETGHENPHFATTLHNMAGLLFVMGKFSEALPVVERSLAIRKRTLGTSHPDVAMSIGFLGMIAKNQGRLDEALDFLQQSLAIDESILGSDHPITQDIRKQIDDVRMRMIARSTSEKKMKWWKKD